MRVVVEIDRWSHPACASADLNPSKRRACAKHLAQLLYDLARDLLEAVNDGIEIGELEVEGEVVRYVLGSSRGNL